MGKLKKIITNPKNYNITIPIIAVLLGFLVGAVIMLFSGLNPKYLFTSLLRGVLGIEFGSPFNPRYIGEYFVYCMPLILTGLAVAFSFKAGLFNIGAEGQFIVGAYASVAVGLYLKLPAIIHLPLIIIAGALGGALWAFIPGFLKAKYKIHEVVVTIMLNYAAMYITGYLLKIIPGSNTNKTLDIPIESTLKSEFLSSITNGSRLNWGFIIVIIAIFVSWFIMNKTTFGYELRAVGMNPNAAEYAGIKVKRNTILSMMISGAFAGLAGTIVAVGVFGYGRVIGSFENYGYDGIAVALVGGKSALGSAFGGLLLGSLKAAQPIMQSNAIPRDIAIIISSLIILFVAMQNGIKLVLKKIGGEN